MQETIGKLAGEQIKPVPYTMVEKCWKHAGQLVLLKVNRWPQATSKPKIIDDLGEKCQIEIQKKVATEIAEASDEISLGTKSPLERAITKQFRKIISLKKIQGKKSYFLGS